MAAFASPTAVAPSLPRLRPGAGNPTSGAFSAARLPGLRPSRPSAVRASLKDAAVAVIATAASAAIAVGNAAAVEVLLGSDDGTLAFVPSQITVKAGEKIVFRNNAGFPHNVVFDEDEVPPGVDVAKISMGEEDLLNAPGETFAVTLTEKGTYTFYCTPHQGAGMAGKVTVN